ncbi:putative Sphingolipid Delta4 desaturase (DES) Fatty acid desaturase [Trypanosoma vivax]|nr:putative fatty acid desaturase [Trypanosoma vivax]KAH8614066.1 putative Sphingolipid Delta4 desaturase (DES) Fatty acid desaturase [Trypanosoma vivax]
MVVSISSALEVITRYRGPNDYYWTTNDEMHADRRKMMMEKYGDQIRKLFGPDPLIWKIAIPLVFLQIYIGSLAASMSWSVFLLVAYFVGGTITHNSFLAVHEITHNLAFHTIAYNDYCAILLNIIVPLPYAMTFKSYHKEHHKYIGWEGVDTDVPTALEARLLSNYFGKFIFVTFQVFFYVLRPSIIRKIQFQRMHYINIVTQIVFDIILYKLFGLDCILYFLFSIFLGTNWHPIAGHFISEHFVFKGDGKQETFSYYGPLNLFAWNVGYHVEHHDFPFIPWTRLHKLREIAPEFYQDLIVTESWPLTLINFVLDKNVNQFSRVTRERGAYKREKLVSNSIKK